MINYTENGEIVRGSRWPPADCSLTIYLTHAGGWPAGADGWTWTLQFARAIAGGAVDLELTADAATLDGDLLTLYFHAEDTETATLPGTGKTRFYVDLQSDDGALGVSYYDCVQGYADCRDPAGNV